MYVCKYIFFNRKTNEFKIPLAVLFLLSCYTARNQKTKPNVLWVANIPWKFISHSVGIWEGLTHRWLPFVFSHGRKSEGISLNLLLKETIHPWRFLCDLIISQSSYHYLKDLDLSTQLGEAHISVQYLLRSHLSIDSVCLFKIWLKIHSLKSLLYY